MNRFADYFSNYVNDDTITYIGNGDISSFTVSRQNRELTVGVSFDSFVDYAVIDNAQNQIAQAMELKKVHLKPRFPKSQFSLDGIERILEYVRHETHYSQEVMSEKLGLTRKKYRKYEKEIMYPDADTLVQMYNLYKCRPSMYLNMYDRRYYVMQNVWMELDDNQRDRILRMVKAIKNII